MKETVCICSIALAVTVLVILSCVLSHRIGQNHARAEIHARIRDYAAAIPHRIEDESDTSEPQPTPDQ